MNTTLLIGRILFSLAFIMLGFGHLFNYQAMSQYAASVGVPAPTVAVIVSGIMIVLGGLSVALGYRAKIGVLLLAIFLIPVTFMMHAFWGLEDPMQSQLQMVMFLKNLSMLGGALIIYYFGTGPLSLDRESDTQT